MKIKKNIFLLVFVIASLCASFVSCEIGNDEEEFGEDLLNLSKETISAKWIPSDNSIYESIEFNENGQYFIIEKAQEERSAKNHTKMAMGMLRSGGGSETVYCGTYQIIDDITIELSNYGTMEAYEITSEKLYGCVLKNGEKSWIDFSKQQQMEDSQYINALCRTWYIPNADIDFIIFQKSGTYYTIMEDEGVFYFDYGTWAWKTGETAFTMWYADAGLEGVCESRIDVLLSNYMRVNTHDVVHVDGETHYFNEIIEFIAFEEIVFPEPPKVPGPGDDDEGPEDKDPEPGIIYPIDILGTWECTFNIEFSRVDGEINLESIKQNTKIRTYYTFNVDGTLECSHSYDGHWTLEDDILTITINDDYPLEYSILTLNYKLFEIECDMLLDLDGVEQVSIYEKMKFKKVVN